jgi:hypothetical protein
MTTEPKVLREMRRKLYQIHTCDSTHSKSQTHKM